jgi:hypothetical protein
VCALQGLGERIQALNKEVFGGVLSSEQLQQLESSEAKQVSHHHIYYVTSSYILCHIIIRTMQQLESSEAKQVLCLVIYHIICCMLCGVPCITGALTHYIKGVVTY